MRLARGDVGINELDNACMEHDKWYHENRTAETRHEGDLKLAEAAAKVARDPTATIDEREKANLVVAIMHGKKWLGAGYQRGSGLGLHQVYRPLVLQRGGGAGDALSDGWAHIDGDAPGTISSWGSSSGSSGIFSTLASAVGSIVDFFARRRSEQEAKRKLEEEKAKAAKQIGDAVGRAMEEAKNMKLPKIPLTDRFGIVQ